MTDQEFHTLTTYIKQHYGIDLTKKRVLIESRMAQELRSRGFSSFRQYMDVLFQDTTGQESITLLNKLTTNLSYFMRENDHFQYLANQVLPTGMHPKGSMCCGSGAQAVPPVRRPTTLPW
ncbi:MAG: hypothetical protein V8Q30_10840 [Acutalibacteraceae bacterium]